MSWVYQDLRDIEDQIDNIEVDGASKEEIDAVFNALEAVRKAIKQLDEVSSRPCPHDYVETHRCELICMDCGALVRGK